MIDLKQIAQAFDSYRANELVQLNKLFDYYIGKHDILEKKNRVKGKADAKIVSGYAEYISTIATAYFLGKNISYVVDEEKKNNFEKLREYLATEEEQQSNFETALNCSIFGKAYELIYIDEFKQLKIKALDTRDVFVLKDNSINQNVIAAVRFGISKISDSEYDVTLEVYDNTTVATHQFKTSSLELAKMVDLTSVSTQERLHGFKRVPILEYQNNKFSTGDFERVIGYINAYNTAVSTSIDDLTDFSDAYLVLHNLSGTTEEDLERMKNHKIFMVDGDGTAKWLIKEANDIYSQNIKDRLNGDIHKFSFTPDMTDEKFSGNTSGVALEFKLLPLEHLGSQKEMYFKKTLNERLEILIDFLNIDLKATDIQKIFTRTLPRNLKEISEVMQNLRGVLSHRTIIGLFPSIEDPQVELDKFNAEEEHEDNKYYKDRPVGAGDEILAKKTDREGKPSKPIDPESGKGA
jgi:phage portal protein, SPP1 family